MASDLAHDTISAMVKELKKGLKEKGNSDNTGGTENVAMFLCEFVYPANNGYSSVYHETLVRLVTDTITGVEYIIDAMKYEKENWDDMDSWQEHIVTYRRWKRKLKKLSSILDEE